MSMTNEEKFAKQLIMTRLSEQGYPTYSKLLNEFDLNLTENPNVVAFMEPATGRIVVNRGLEETQVSVIIRHEILHAFLKHELRLLQKLARDRGIDYDSLVDTELDELTSELKNVLYSNDDFNIAADYEISNLGYTDADKDAVRQININGQILSGLVTEDEHPDWIDYSVEDMYQELTRLRKKDQGKLDDSTHFGNLIDKTTFVDLNGVAYGI